MAKEKSRYFTFLLYPDGEGFPSDWEERLEKWSADCYQSTS